MFGFGRSAGITDNEMWTLAIRVAVKMTAEEDALKHVVGIQKSRELLDAECKQLRLRPTPEQQKYIDVSAHALAGTELARSLMDRWLKDRRVTITQADIGLAGQLLEHSVQNYLGQRNKDTTAPWTGSSGIEQMEQAFDATLKQVKEKMSAGQQAAVAYGVAFAWRAFNVKFSSPQNFMGLASENQNNFIEGVEKMAQGLIERNDPEVALGMHLANMYFAALMGLAEEQASGAMVNHMADQLEPLNIEGSVRLG